MSTSTLVALILVGMAIMDTVLARTWLPKMLEQQHITEEQKASLLRFVDVSTVAVCGIAVGVYLLQPWG